jgi:hypothetical protein
MHNSRSAMSQWVISRKARVDHNTSALPRRTDLSVRFGFVSNGPKGDFMALPNLVCSTLESGRQRLNSGHAMFSYRVATAEGYPVPFKAKSKMSKLRSRRC